MYTIRNFNSADFSLLSSWWEKRQKEHAPTLDMMPEGTSYIIEYNNVPIASMCWISTNCKAVAYCANFISNPEIEKKVRKEAVKLLFDHISKEARDRGYQNLLAFSHTSKVGDRFSELGMRPTMIVTSFVRSL